MRGRAITDTLTELLVDTVHRIGTKADRRVSEALQDDIKRVTGKTNLLFALADASLTTPDGPVRDVVFPVVGEETLRAGQGLESDPRQRRLPKCLATYHLIGAFDFEKAESPVDIDALAARFSDPAFWNRAFREDPEPALD